MKESSALLALGNRRDDEVMVVLFFDKLHEFPFGYNMAPSIEGPYYGSKNQTLTPQTPAGSVVANIPEFKNVGLQGAPIQRRNDNLLTSRQVKHRHASDCPLLSPMPCHRAVYR